MINSLRTTAAILAATVALHGPAEAAPHKAASPRDNPRCAQLAVGVDTSVKGAALTKASGAGDGAADQAEIQNKLLMMQSLSCKPYSGHVSTTAYYLPALQCWTAMQQARNEIMRANGSDAAHSWPTERPAQCDMSKWEAAPVD